MDLQWLQRQLHEHPSLALQTGQSPTRSPRPVLNRLHVVTYLNWHNALRFPIGEDASTDGHGREVSPISRQGWCRLDQVFEVITVLKRQDKETVKLHQQHLLEPLRTLRDGN